MSVDNMEVLVKLQEDIERIEREVKTKKAMVDLLKKQQKRTFIETGVGRGYLKMMRVLTSPFAGFHKKADLALEAPERYLADGKLSEAMSVLKRCEGLSPKDKKTKSALLTAAELRMELSKYKDQVGVPEVQERLKTEIERLRPGRSPEQQKQLQAAVSDTLAQASSLAAGISDQPF